MIYAKVGMKGHNVKVWQESMNKVRAQIGNPQVDTDGVFGPQTLKATINTQKYIGVKPDGIVGDGTYKAFRAKFPVVATFFVDVKDTALKTQLDKEALPTKKIFPRINPVPPPITPQPTPPPPKKSFPVLPLALVGIGAYFFMNKMA